MTAHRIMHKKQTGFSLVELMVAAIIGLIGTIVIFQVFAAFESQKRATTAGGDAQSNLALGMHAIERDVRQAGFGINDPAFFGCAVNGWEEAGSGAAFTVPFVPVLITQGATASDPDALTVFYGSSSLAHFAPALNQNLGAPTNNYRVSNRHGFELGDVLILAELRGLPQVPDCIIAQVQELPSTAGNTDTIVHASSTYDLNGFPAPTKFNKAAGIGPNYNFGSTKVFNLGRKPVLNTYTVSNGQLMLQSPSQILIGGGQSVLERLRGAAAPMMDGIVQMQARYGKDDGSNGGTADDGIVDGYDEIAPTTPAQWAQVLTIRVAMAARVSQYEKDLVPNSASITLLPASGAVLPVTWIPSAEDQHYRYRVIDTIIPIRNMIWKRATP